jgi:hypothetical protein
MQFVDLYGKTPQIRKAWARHCILFPIESRNVFPLPESTSNKKAKSAKSVTEKEVILQHNSEPIVLKEAEREEQVKVAESLDESSVEATQCSESKTNPSFPAADNNSNINNGIDHGSDVEKTDLVSANSEPETINHKPDRSLQMSERVELQTLSKLNPGQSPTVLGPSPTKGEHSKLETESGQDLTISNSHPARSNNLTSQSQDKMASSQPYQMFPTGALAQSLVSALCILHFEPCFSSF